MRAALLLLLAGLAAAEPPGRHIRYAESSDRLVYAIVFGHADSCRVFRRPAPPRLDLATMLRQHYGADWRGHSDETMLVEFSFGSSGRPVHIVPTNDGRYVVGFANRAADGGEPKQDKIHRMAEKGYGEGIGYGELPRDVLPDWPEFERVLPYKKHEKSAPAGSASYAFLSRQASPERLLVARQTEEGDLVSEMTCFAVDFESGTAQMASDGELKALLQGKGEPLWRGGAAWAVCHRADHAFLPALKAALGRATLAAERASIARAIVACGEDSGRKTLRALLADADAGARRNGAFALAMLPPDRRDADVLGEALTDSDAETARLAALALARLQQKAINTLLRLSRSSRPERRLAAARVLARIDTAAAEKRLLALARDMDIAVQTGVAVALTAPPRAILPENHADYGRALAAAGKSGNKSAARRLSLLAYHARIHHEEVYEGLVACAAVDAKAIWALRKLTGERLETPEQCEQWWKSRPR